MITEHELHVENLERELTASYRQLRVKEQELGRALKELLRAHDVLQVIATSSSDTASRLVAEGILYREEP